MTQVGEGGGGAQPTRAAKASQGASGAGGAELPQVFLPGLDHLGNHSDCVQPCLPSIAALAVCDTKRYNSTCMYRKEPRCLPPPVVVKIDVYRVCLTEVVLTRKNKSPVLTSQRPRQGIRRVQHI